MRRSLALVPALLLLAACEGGWFGDKEAPPLPGERLPVLVYDQQLQADPTLKTEPQRFTPPERNTDWLSAGGRADHGGGSYTLLSTTPKEAWSADIGDGTSADKPLIPTPVITGGIVYSLDSGSTVRAFSAETGKKLWDMDVAPSSERGDATGGGLTLADGKLFVATGYGEVLALNPADGATLWRKSVQAPLRSAPAAGGGLVFVVSIDNRLHALDATTGDVRWNHAGIIETAGLLGAPSPALGSGALLVAYSSGELFALRLSNGREMWADNLASSRREGGVMSIAAIRGQPVLAANGQAALAVSNSGRMVAIDTRSGQRVWDQRIGGNQMPWVSGTTVFMVSNQAQLMALNLIDGRIRWISPLAQWKHPETHDGVIAWYGPIFAGGKLWLTNSEGHLRSFDPADGKELEIIKTGTAITRPPIVADGTLYTLDDSATLTAWR